MSKEHLIRLQGVTKEFFTKNGKVRALNDINLDIDEGDIYGIIGLSGAGKSTLIRCINLLETPTEGKVIFNGKALMKLKHSELNAERRNISMIFQQFNLLMQRNALENVCFPMEIAGKGKKEAKDKALELLKIVNLEERASSYPSQLSGGQKQRVAIARALATNPKVLLCDEATSALDPKTTRSILSLLKEINTEFGITIVLITHEMSVIKQICNKVAIIENGEIVERGNVQEVFTKPKSQVARKLFFPDGDEKNVYEMMTNKNRVRLVFDDALAYEPKIANMILTLKEPVNILYANMQVVEDRQKGQMVLSLSNDLLKAEQQKQYLRDNNIDFIELEENE